MPEARHKCKLGIHEIKSYYPPDHPQRYFSELFFRRIRKYISLDVNDRKCKSFFSNSKDVRSEFKRHFNSPYHYIIHPFSKANAFMEIVFLLLLIYRYTLLAVVGELLMRLQTVADILWTLSMLSIFFTGYVNHNTKEIVIHPKAIAVHYIKTYFIFDLILVVNTPLQLCVDNWIFDMGIILLAIISYFVRFGTMLCYLTNIMLYIGMNKLKSFFIYEILKLTFFLHLITCVFLVIPEQVNPEFFRFWLHHFGDPSSKFEIYWKSLLVIVCYFFGADYDIEMTDPLENLVLFLLSLVGRLYTLALIARFLGVYGITDISHSKYEQQLMVLWNYLNSLQIPDGLRQRIVTSFQKQLNKQSFDEREITSNLTDNLKTELFLYGARALITKHSVLARIPRADLLALLSIMESKMFESKDVIMAAGDKLQDAYFISSGTVAGYDLEGNEVIHLKEGDLFGISWMAFRDVKDSLMTWVALETTEVYCVTREELTRYFHYQKDVARYFELKVKEIFQKYEYCGSVEQTERKKYDMITSLRKGEILEKQKLRLFNIE